MWEQIEKNKNKTIFLVLAMAVLFMAVGFILGNLYVEYIPESAQQIYSDENKNYTEATTSYLSQVSLARGTIGVGIALIVWVVLALIAFYNGDKIVLWSAKAKRINYDNHPVLFNIVEEMCIASGLEYIPYIYIIDEAAPNAFAVGKDPENATVAVTSGLLTKLNRDELQGVIAHEIAHIQNRDVLLMTMLSIMLGVIVVIGEIMTRRAYYSRYRSSSNSRGNAISLVLILVLGILAPLLAQIIYFAASRTREYLADACAVQYTRYPAGLANALEKISHASDKLTSANKVTAAMFIINPLKLTSKGLEDLSSTHPPTSKRIEILRSMTHDVSFNSYNKAFSKSTGKAVGVIPFSAVEDEEILVEEHMEDFADNEIERMRQVSNMFWGINNFIFIACGCGTNLKIPQDYKDTQIQCPHCDTMHLAVNH